MTDQLILNYWLVKSEPDTYGWHQFTQQGRAIWDGVRNYQARNNLNAMRTGDQVLFYHSVTNPGRSRTGRCADGRPLPCDTGRCGCWTGNGRSGGLS